MPILRSIKKIGKNGTLYQRVLRRAVTFFCLFILLSLSSKEAAGQVNLHSTNKKAQKLYEKSQKHIQSFDWEEAAKLLQEALKSDPDFMTASQQLGDIYRKQKKYALAIQAYQNVLEKDPELTPLTYYGLGESYLFTGQYTEAKKHLSRYLETANLSQKSKKKVEKYLADCEFSLSQGVLHFQNDLQKLNAEINTRNDEYFPKLTADNHTLIFTRKESNKENFYESIKEKDQWTEARILEGDINTESFNEGSHCISLDGKYLFFAGCNRPDGLGSCDIYVSKKENGRWSAPHNLGSPVNTSGWESQPAISADGRTLYFVSTRPGGYGGADIWKSELKNNGNWSEPENLGASINTPYDESSPYIHGDNKTLYFASDGWPGFGQKDIFKSIIDSSDTWSTPENLGPEINSYTNQNSFHISLNGQTAHLASENEQGKYDIYQTLLPKNIQATPVAFIDGEIVDAENKEALHAQVSITDTKSGEIVFKDESDVIDGKFLATLPIGNNYAVHYYKKGYLFQSKNYNLTDTSEADKKYKELIELQTIKPGALTVLENIYFEFDKADLLSESKLELQLLIDFLKTHPQVVIEVQGHTDDKGEALYNKKLSESRAKSVKDYLINHSIPAQNIVTVGYGDSKPIASNKSEEGRQKNRRTSFLILN